MLKVFYYNYFLFYTKILVQPQPHLVTTLALSFVESLFLNGFMDILAVSWFCYKMNKWFMIVITLTVILCNSLILFRADKSERIISEKPLFFRSKKLSMIIVLLSTLLVISWLFWGSFYSRDILSNCK